MNLWIGKLITFCLAILIFLSGCSGEKPLYRFVTPPCLNLQPKEITIRGNYAIITGGDGGLHVMDILDPENPKGIKTITFPGEALETVISGNLAFVHCENVGFLYAIDITDPEKAHEEYTSPNMSGEDGTLLAVHKGYAFMGCRNWSASGHLYIFDHKKAKPPWRSTGGSIEPLRTIKMPMTVTALAALGDYAYIIEDGAGFSVLDISSIESCKKVKTLNIGGNAKQVKLHNGYAFLPDGDRGLHIIDINSPTSPVLIDTIDIPAKYVVFEGTNLYVSGENALCIMDASNPHAVIIKQTISRQGLSGHFAVSGEYVFFVNEFNRLEIFNVGWDESKRREIGSPLIANGVAVRDGYAYVADSAEELQIYLVDPPVSNCYINAVRLPEIGIEEHESNSADGYSGHSHSSGMICGCQLFDKRGVILDNGYAYIAEPYAGLHIVNIKEPAAAFYVKGIRIPGGALDVAVHDGYAYVAGSDDGMVVVDVREPAEAGIISTSGTSTMAVEVYDGKLYAACEQSLIIMDLTVPAIPSIVKEIDCARYGSSLTVCNGMAYMLTGAGVIVTFDIEPAETANIVGVGGDFKYASGIVTDGDYLYVIQSRSVHMLDLDELEFSDEILKFRGLYSTIDLAVYKGKYYIADGTSGLNIVELLK